MPKTSTNETDDGIDQYNIDYIFNTFGSVDFGSDIVPSAHNAYTLGNSSYFWLTGYITSLNTAQLTIPSTGPLNLKNHLLPDTDNTRDLGSASNRFRNLYVNNLLFSQISGNIFTSTSGPLVFTTPNPSDSVQINRDLVPSLNNTYRVGTSALTWLAVHGSTIFSNNIDGGGQPIVFNGSLRPISSNVYFLGSNDRVWNQGHISNLFNTTLNTRTVSGNTSGDLILTTVSAGNVISVDRHIVPVGTGLTNLGGGTNRFATVFANTVDVPTLAANILSSSSGNLLVTTPVSTDLVTVNRDLAPSTNEGASLGVVGQRWGNIRGASVITNLVGNGVGTLNFDSNVAPLADLTKSIGTPTNRFLDANIGTVNSSTLAGNTLTTSTHNDLLITTANPTHKVTIQRSLVPTADGTLDLGAAHLKYNNLYCNTINAPAFNVDTISTATTTDLTLTTQSSSNTVKTPRNFTPTVTNTQTLGTSALTWSQIYATTVFTGTINNSAQPILFGGSIRPLSDNLYNIGNTNLRFNNGYIRQIWADTIVETPLLRAGTAADLNLTTVTASNNIVSQRNLLPNANNTLNLGSSSVRWNTIFASTLNITTLSLNSLSSTTGNLTLTTPSASDLILLDRTTVPSADITYNLGSATNRFLNLYAQTVFTNTINTGAGSLTVTGSVLPSTDNSFSLGTSGQRFTAAHITTLNSTTVNTSTVQAPATTDLTLTTTTTSNNIVAARNILPNTDNTRDLGSSGTRFANVYATNVNATSYNANTISSVTGNLLLTAPLVSDTVTTNRTFRPTTDNTIDLGTSTIKWANIYGTTGYFSTISNNNNWINTAGGLRPNNDNQHWIGELTKRYQRLYAVNTFTDTIASTGTSNLLLTTPTASQVVSCERDLLPQTDSFSILGSTSKRWANIHGTIVTTSTLQPPLGSDLTISGGVGLTNIRAATNLLPDITNTYDTGSTSLLWNRGYFNNVYTNNLRGVTGAITNHNSIVPVSNNSLNLGSSSSRYALVHTQIVNCSQFQNQNGTEITCTENFSPSVTQSYNLGSSTLQWLNTYTTNLYSDLLFGLASNIISVAHDFVPLVTFATNLGSSLKKFAEGYIGELYTNSLRSLNNFGTLIRVFNDLVPEGIVSLGTSLKSFTTGFFQTLRTQAIEPISGNTVFINSDLLTNSTANVGGGSTPATKYFNSFWGYTFFTRQAEAFGHLTSPVQSSSSGSFQPFTFEADPNSSYYGGPNLIKFPNVGLYVIHLNVRADTDLITPNYLIYTLYRTNNNTYYGHEQFHLTGIYNGVNIIPNSAPSQTSLTFPYFCADTADRVQIRTKITIVTVTGVALNAGSMVYRIVGTG